MGCEQKIEKEKSQKGDHTDLVKAESDGDVRSWPEEDQQTWDWLNQFTDEPMQEEEMDVDYGNNGKCYQPYPKGMGKGKGPPNPIQAMMSAIRYWKGHTGGQKGTNRYTHGK